LFKRGAASDASSWPKALGIEVDNLRAALNWAFSAEGDAKVGVDLAAASASSWMGMGLVTECRDWMRKAVDHLKGANSGTRQEMIIHSAFASCLIFTAGMSEESYATWARARLLAEALGDFEHQLASLLILWAHRIRLPRYAEAIELAERCGEVAQKSGDRGAIAMANYMRGVSYHHTGRLLQAENCLKTSLDGDDEVSRQALIRRFGYDRKVESLMILSSVMWLRGSPDQARRLIQMSLAEARKLDQVIPLCVTLAGASFNAYRAGRDEESEALVDELVDYAGKYGVESYHGFGIAMQALGRIKRRDTEATTELLYSGLEKLAAVRYHVFHPIMQAEFARCLAVVGLARQAIAVFERAKIDLDDENQLFAPELIRIRGELALSNDEGVAVCRQYFLRAIELSDRQGSVAWTLRAATSLAMAEKSDARREQARTILRSAHAKFPGGSDTYDLRLATRVLDGSYWRDEVAGTAL
jgi:tetratricopeptide (TPR) repeat protein